MQTKQLYHQLYCGPKLLWADYVWAEKVMGRFCHGPILLWAELSSDLRCLSLGVSMQSLVMLANAGSIVCAEQVK